MSQINPTATAPPASFETGFKATILETHNLYPLVEPKGEEKALYDHALDRLHKITRTINVEIANVQDLVARNYNEYLALIAIRKSKADAKRKETQKFIDKVKSAMK